MWLISRPKACPKTDVFSAGVARIEKSRRFDWPVQTETADLYRVNDEVQQLNPFACLAFPVSTCTVKRKRFVPRRKLWRTIRSCESSFKLEITDRRERRRGGRFKSHSPASAANTSVFLQVALSKARRAPCSIFIFLGYALPIHH